MLDLNLGFRFAAIILLLTSVGFSSLVHSKCTRGCDLALASYYVEPGNDLDSISRYTINDINSIIRYNRDMIPNQYSIQAHIRINIPFSCDCIDGEFLGHVFNYEIQIGDTYDVIAEQRYANLTTADWIQRFNTYDPSNIPVAARINVTVNCSCGDSSVSRDYGLLVTYPLRQGETLNSVSLAANLSPDLIRRYNPDFNFNGGRGLLYIPGRDANGTYRPLRTSSETGLSGGAIGGIIVAVVAGVLLLALAGCLYYGFYSKKDPEDSSALIKNTQVQLMQTVQIDKSMEFSYEELSKATDDFSLANKIGQGGFGAIYYAELRGEDKTGLSETKMHFFVPPEIFGDTTFLEVKGCILTKRKLLSRRWISKHRENF